MSVVRSLLYQLISESFIFGLELLNFVQQQGRQILEFDRLELAGFVMDDQLWECLKKKVRCSTLRF